MRFTRKIFILVFISSFVIIAGMFFFTHLWILKHHRYTVLRSEKELARLSALKSEDYILRNDRIELYNLYASIVKIDPYIDYIFAEQNGEVYLHTFNKGVPRGLLSLSAIGDSSMVDVTPIVDGSGRRIQHLRILLSAPENTVLHFGVSQTAIDEDLDEHRNILVIISLLIIIIAPLLTSIIISRFLSKPFAVLKSGIKEIERGNLDLKIELDSKDEIGNLAEDINRMAEELEVSRSTLEMEIEERRVTEDKLLEQSEILNNVLDNIPQYVFWKDKSLKYLGCNRAFAEALRIQSSDRVIGNTDHSLPWTDEDAESLRKIEDEVMTSGRPVYDREVTLFLPISGEKFFLINEAPLRNDSGYIFGVLGLFYDITERKKVDDAMRQFHKMEAIGTLAGGIAHDFNNILTGIIGYAELAVEKGKTDERVQKYNNLILKLSERAKRLIHQILVFSRKTREEKKNVRLSDIISEEITLIRSTLPSTIEISFSSEKEYGLIYADATQIHQILMNLCTNASHAMDENGGVIKISLSSRILTDEDMERFKGLVTGPYAELTISDDGNGIPPDIIERIFEPYYTTKEVGRGTGMGLAVVQGIVKNHGGEISVSSKQGKGTSFTILLPYVCTDPDETVNDEEPVLSLGKERLLFVDDEELLLEMGEEVLSSLGYSVTTSNSSVRALEIFTRSPYSFDLIITDQTMPHMTGLNLAKKIVSIRPDARIILYTGYSDTMNNEIAEEAGIKKLIYKPINRKELAAVVREVLDR